MRTTVTIPLPSDLKAWVDRQATDGGYDTAAEYVRDVLRRARERDARREVDAMLIAAAEAGATVSMTDADWAAIRRAARTAVKPRKAAVRTKR